MTMLLAANDKSSWSGNVVLSANTAHFDSARVDYAFQSLDDTNTSLIANHPAPASTVVWYSMRLWLSTAATYREDGWLGVVRDVNSVIISRFGIQDGKVRAISYGDATVSGGYTSLLATGFNEIKMKVDTAGGNITTEIFHNGVSVSTAVAANTTGKGVARHWKFDYTNAIRSLQYFSEFAVYDTEPANGRYTKLSPTVIGTDVDWSGGFVDISDDNIGTAIASSLVNEKSSFYVDVYAGGASIAELCISMHIASGLGAPPNFRLYLLIGGVRYYGTTQALTMGAPTLASESWALDPSDSLAWTVAKVNATQFGVETLA